MKGRDKAGAMRGRGSGEGLQEKRGRVCLSIKCRQWGTGAEIRSMLLALCQGVRCLPSKPKCHELQSKGFSIIYLWFYLCMRVYE